MSTRRDPFDVPLVLLRVGWMDRSRGTAGGDHISGGGPFVAEHDDGQEMFNLLPFAGGV